MEQATGTENRANSLCWVGIGSSAGGLEAMQILVSNLPDSKDYTYILAQHFSPTRQSLMAKLLQRKTTLKVVEATDGVKPEGNTLYVTPPNSDIIIKDGRLSLIVPDQGRKPNPSVDVLFESMASELGNDAIGIILSGTGRDGAKGLCDIQAAGGLTIVEDARSAKYDGMPNASISTGCVDIVLPPAEIGQRLHGLRDFLKSGDHLRYTKYQDELTSILGLVNMHTGVNFSEYKKSTINRRILRRMVALSLSNYKQYLDFVAENTDELDTLFKDLLINVTEFYRDTSAFDALKEQITMLVNTREPDRPIRIWVTACSTGEEVYTIAMLFAECLGGKENFSKETIQIFATDIDKDALIIARAGQYPATATEKLPEGLRDKYFVQNGNTYSVDSFLKEVVLFAHHNLTQDAPFMKTDLICCRNVLIYFEPSLQKKVFKVFHYSLRPDGILFLGRSETEQTRGALFEAVDEKHRIYRKKAGDQYYPEFAGRRVRAELNVQETSSDSTPVNPLFTSLLSQLGDSAVLTDKELYIEETYGNTDNYLRIPTGRADLSLKKLAREGLGDEIVALWIRADKRKMPVYGKKREYTINGEPAGLQITIYPLQGQDDKTVRFLVVFNKTAINIVPSSATSEGEEGRGIRIAELEDELVTTRQHLQTLVQELETSNEELQSLNEELHSANEELQATNEEMETANEELQSTNEELVTVNDELNDKSQELENTAAELINVRNSADYPIIVVDKKYRIQSYNNAAEREFELENEGGLITSYLPEFCNPSNIKKLTKKVLTSGEAGDISLDSDSCSY
ncbi:MAG: chemotaxis protein CheB, partial [Cyclobacteriaceae bacterium]